MFQQPRHISEAAFSFWKITVCLFSDDSFHLLFVSVRTAYSPSHRSCENFYYLLQVFVAEKSTHLKIRMSGTGVFHMQSGISTPEIYWL